VRFVRPNYVADTNSLAWFKSGQINLPMELRHIRYFVVLAKELNFRRAAEVLRVAHPSLSKQIKDLERELEVNLFDRTTKKVQLTKAGRVFLKHAKTVLAKTDQAVLAARAAVWGQRDKMVLGSFGNLCSGFLPAAISRFSLSNPRVEITLREIDLGQQIAQLEDKKIQIAFTVITQGEPEITHLEQLTMFEIDPVVMISKVHRLASKVSVALTDLTNETVLCVSDNLSGGRHARLIKHLFEARSLRAPKVKRVEGFDILFALAVGNQGVTIVPGLPNSPAPIGLVERPLEMKPSDPKYQVRAVWLKNEASASVKNFIDALKLETSRRVRPR